MPLCAIDESIMMQYKEVEFPRESKKSSNFSCDQTTEPDNNTMTLLEWVERSLASPYRVASKRSIHSAIAWNTTPPSDYITH